MSTLAPDSLAPLLTGAYGRPYAYAREAASTQDMLGPDAPHGAVAVADVQSAGRGRRGRVWQAPPGSALLFSLALRPPCERRRPELSLVAGVAVADALEAALGLAVQIKWPNDLMIDRRKVAGILAEARGDLVVLGIGVNVNQTRAELPAGTRVPAASLRTVTGVERPRGPLLAAILAALERTYDAWRDGGLDAVFAGLGSRDFLRGRRVAADGQTGVGGGIDREGRLLIDLDAGGRYAVEAGEVELAG